MITPVKILGNATVASFEVATAGMTLSVSAGFYANGLGSLAWDATDITVPTTPEEQNFGVWLLEDGTLHAAMTPAPNYPTPPTNMRDRLLWGAVPSTCTDLASATIHVLTIVAEGGA